MTTTSLSRRLAGPRLRPDWAWQLRQGSALVYVIWFAVAVPLVIVGLLLEPRWVGWFVLAWFLREVPLRGAAGPPAELAAEEAIAGSTGAEAIIEPESSPRPSASPRPR